MRRYYAIEYADSRIAARPNDHTHFVHRFESADVRDAFVGQDPHKRVAVSAKHPYVHLAKEEAAKGLEWPVAVVD